MSTITAFPTTNSPTGWPSWNSPANVYADDGVYADAAPTIGSSDYGNLFGGCGFDALIPAGSTINSVTVSGQYKMTLSGADTYTFGLQPWISGVGYGAEKTDTTQPSVDTIISQAYTGLVRNDLLDANFKIRARASANNNGGKTFNLDYVKVVVDFTPPISSNGNLFMFSN